MDNHPFFALLLMYLKFVAVAQMKKISTNGRCIYFSPDFVDKLRDNELDYILCHQIMHIVCGHIWRPYDLAGADYHFACDILINALLENCGFNEERYTHLGYVYKNIPSVDTDPSELTPELIYDSLPYSLYMFDERTRNKFLPDTDAWWDRKDDNGLCDELILDLPEIDGMLKAVNSQAVGEEIGDSGDGGLQQGWQTRVATAATIMESVSENSQSFSNAPDFIKRMIKKMKQPTIDWKKILNNFIQERISDYSFSPPDRRFADTDFFLPDFNEKEFVQKEILFMVDTSGSVDDYELATVYSEVCGAIEQFGGSLIGKLGFFDASVTPPLPFSSVAELMNIIPYGGGGTDFRAIFKYIRENYRRELPACVIIFTDGCGPYPNKELTMGIPVLWIINNPNITPPFGKITRIISAAPNNE